MKEKTESFESVMAKAEKFFARGNYPLARAEFEKAARMAEPGEIFRAVSEKIEICRAEADKIRARELIKKARKFLQKKHIPEALKCYDQAYTITGDDSILEKMEGLRRDLAGRDASKTAVQSEAAGDYMRAAELYGQAFATTGKEELLVRKARCMVKAESYHEAVEIFQPLGPTDPGTLYDYGFALAKVGRYHECLKVWEALDSRDDRFMEQRETVRALLAQDIRERLEPAHDLASVHEEGMYLLNTSGGHTGASQEIKSLAEKCKYALIESLWADERYEEIAELLLPYPADPGDMTPALLALCAKTFYMSAVTSGRRLSDLTLFWLTAVYDRDIFETFADEEEKRREVRRELILRAERLIRPLLESAGRASRKEGIYWGLEKGIIAELDRLVEDRADPGRLVCTPRFAERFGRSSGVLEFIRSRKDSFEDPERYHAMGAYYSAARESIYQVESGDFDEAMAALPESKPDDEFAGFGIMKVNYTCGLYFLETEGGRLGHFFEGTAGLFDIAPRYEEQLVKKALDAYELEQLEGYEDILGRIRRLRPSKPITEALSVVMSMRAMILYNRNKLSSRALEALMKEALKLYPENQQARIALKDAREGMELMELEKAMVRHKMSKAFRIAEQSQYASVRDHYFQLLEDLVESLAEADLTREEKLFFFEDLREWCARMDPSHPLLERIDYFTRGMI